MKSSETENPMLEFNYGVFLVWPLTVKSSFKYFDILRISLIFHPSVFPKICLATPFCTNCKYYGVGWLMRLFAVGPLDFGYVTAPHPALMDLFKCMCWIKNIVLLVVEVISMLQIILQFLNFDVTFQILNYTISHCTYLIL